MSDDTYTTRQAADALGMAVRSVQLMVDRGDLQAWKTSGGHRRISRASVDAWLARRHRPAQAPAGRKKMREAAPQRAPASAGRPPCVLLIEDSKHFQNLIGLLVRQRFPAVDLHTADDGIAGLALQGQLQPDILLIDILLPGIDGATLISSLRSHPQFAGSQLIVVTSLDEAQREPYAFALAGLPVVHKPDLVRMLPLALGAALAQLGHASA